MMTHSDEELEQITNFLNLSKTGFTAPLYFIQGTVGLFWACLFVKAFLWSELNMFFCSYFFKYLKLSQIIHLETFL